jgi:hypothetical protein
MAHPKDGGLIKTYAALNWIILRLYALAFLGLAYIAVQWLDVANPLLETLSFGFDPLRAIFVLAFVGTFLLLPPLTPGFLRTPRSILAGAVKSVIIVGFTYYLSLTVPLVLQTGLVPNGAELAQLVPLMLKSVAGTAITGSILVACSQQLTRARIKAQGLAANAIAPQELRNMRHLRMDQP